MKLLVADGKALDGGGRRARREGRGVGAVARFRELRWIKPVLAGDTIRFSNQVETKRTSEKRPDGASCRPAIPASTSVAR